MLCEVGVLASVDDVEACDPGAHRQSEHQRDLQVVEPGDGDPGRQRRQQQSRAQPKVGQGGETLGPGITQQK